MSTLQPIIDALAARLRGISVPNGYQTNLGQSIAFGSARFDPAVDPLPAALLNVGPDETSELTPQCYRHRQMVDVLVLDTQAKYNTGQSNLLPAMADVEKALCNPQDPRLGGLVHHIAYLGHEGVEPPEDGSELTGCLMHFLAQYDTPYGG